MNVFKVMQRYQISNPASIDNGKYLTIIKVRGNIVYYIYDGYSEIYCFYDDSDFVYDLLPVRSIK